MARESTAVKQCDDLTIYARSYQASWTERGVKVQIYLEPLFNDTRQGFQFDFTYGREAGPGKLGIRQEEIAVELLRKLQVLMITEMQTAGWITSGHYKGKELWKPAVSTIAPATTAGTPEHKSTSRTRTSSCAPKTGREKQVELASRALTLMPICPWNEVLLVCL